MASVTVRISVKAKEALQKLAAQTGQKLPAVLDEAGRVPIPSTRQSLRRYTSL